MWDFVLFMGFSVLETSAMIYLIFRMFKIELMIPEMIFSGSIMAFISYVLRVEFDLTQVDIVLQLLLTFGFMWLLYRIHYFFAAILTGLTYLAYYLIQTIWFIVMDLLGLFDGIFPLGLSTYVLQTVSATTAFIIGSLLYVTRRGFDYIPDKPKGTVLITSTDKNLFILTLVSILIVSFVTIYYHAQPASILYVLPFLTTPVVYAYLLISYRKDRDY